MTTEIASPAGAAGDGVHTSSGGRRPHRRLLGAPQSDDHSDLSFALAAADEDALDGEAREVFIEAYLDERDRLAKAEADDADRFSADEWERRTTVPVKKSGPTRAQTLTESVRRIMAEEGLDAGAVVRKASEELFADETKAMTENMALIESAHEGVREQRRHSPMLKAAAVESFKALVRKIRTTEGLPIVDAYAEAARRDKVLASSVAGAPRA